MKTHSPFSVSVLTSAAILLHGAVFAADSEPLPFAKATFTEVVNDVQVVPRGSTAGAKAAVKSAFNAPDLVKTGRKSRAQLTADDGTIARVGSNAVFSFDKDSRTVNLERGSILFHSPTGKGGGAIVTNSATASVIGTTIIVTATSDGGFKMFVLEGVAKVKFPDGKIASIHPGQMTFVLPGSKVSDGGKGAQPGPVLDFDLGAMAKDSLLIDGFGAELPSKGKIQSEVNNQNSLIADGDLVRTGLVILGAASSDEFYLTSQDAVQAAVQANNIPAGDAQRLADALSGSFNYTGGPLPENFIFRTPVSVDPFGGGLTGLIAGHLEINASSLDLSTFNDLSEVTLLGAGSGTLVIGGDLDITGLNAGQNLSVGGGSLVIADGAHVRVLFNNPSVSTPSEVEFASLTGVTLTGVTLEASEPGVSLLLGADGLDFSNAGLKAGADLDVDSPGDLNMTGGDATAGGTLTLFSSGKLKIASASLTGADVAISSSGDAHLSGAQVKATSGDLDVVTAATLTVDGSSKLEATSGDFSLFSAGTLIASDSVLKGGTLARLESSAAVTLANLAVEAAAGDVQVKAGTTLDVAGGSFKASSGKILFTSTSGGMTLLSPSSLTLDARDGISISSGANLMVGNLPSFTTTSGSIDITAGGSLTTSAALTSGADINLTASGSVDVNGGSGGVIQASGGAIRIKSTGGGVSVSSSPATNFTAQSVELSAATNLNLATGAVFHATTGGIEASGATITANSVTLEAPNGAVSFAAGTSMDLTGVTINSTSLNLGGLSSGTASQINLSSVTATALNVNIAAQTLVLNGVSFANSSSVRLSSQSGHFNLSGSTITGAVNFTGNVSWGGTVVNANNQSTLIYAPADGIGASTNPIQVLPFDFTGTPLDYAKTHDLSVDSSFTSIPALHRFDPSVALTGADLVPVYAGTLPRIDYFNASEVGPFDHDALEVNGLLARNITVNNGTVDLAPFEGASSLPHVDIFAAGTLNWSGSLTVTGQSLNGYLEIRATDWVVNSGASYSNTFATGGSSYDNASVSLIAVNNLTIPDATVVQDAGSVNLRSLVGDISLTSTTIKAGQVGNVSGTNGGHIRMRAANDLTITGGLIRAERGMVRLDSGGTVTLTNPDVASVESTPPQTFPQTWPVTVRGVALVKIQGGTLSGSGIDIGGPAVDGSGSHLASLEMDGVTLAASTSSGIRMAAATVNLSNIDFPARTQVRIQSNSGVLNIGSSEFGAVNFVSGIKYSGTNIMTVSGINSTVWIEGGTVHYQGASIAGTPLEGASGVAQSLGAAVHVQTLGATQQPGQY